MWVPPTSKGAPFPPLSSRSGILSLLGWERIPRIPVASQVEALCTGNARGTPRSCHHSQTPPDVSVHSRGTCFPCTASTFTPRIAPTTVARGTALWESLGGKPRGKSLRESHRSHDGRDGKRDTAATGRKESARACPLSRRGLTPLGRLEKYPKIHVSTGEESPEAPEQLAWGLALPEATRAGP